MNSNNINVPSPLVNSIEKDALDILTERYNKLIEPGIIAKVGAKVGQLLPDSIKELGKAAGANITAQELFVQTIRVISDGFAVLEEQAAKLSVSEKQILNRINQSYGEYKINRLNEVCLVRSYDLASLVSKYKTQDIFAAFLEGGGTGAFGFWGLPFNLVLSTFLYYRAVQSIAMYYGYDVKNDDAELVIASEVFANALSPKNNNVNNEVSTAIMKIMVMGQAATIAQTARKTWADMVAKNGIPLLLAQMRALANKSAEKALQNAGEKTLEKTLFKDVFEQIGKKLSLKAIGKSVPIVAAVTGALLDTAQMKNVLEYADIFYQKRFILEKESRIHNLWGYDDVVYVDETKENVTDAEITGEETKP